MRSGRSAVAVAIVAIAWSVTASAGQRFVPAGRHTLRGLPGLELIVETVPAPLQRAGLTESSVATQLAAMLKAGGVVVFPAQAANPSAGKAYLDVRTTLLALPDDRYAVAIEMHVRQTVASLVTESKIVNAVTWETGRLVSVGTDDVPRVRDEIREMVEELLADWKAVH